MRGRTNDTGQRVSFHNYLYDLRVILRLQKRASTRIKDDVLHTRYSSCWPSSNRIQTLSCCRYGFTLICLHCKPHQGCEQQREQTGQLREGRSECMDCQKGQRSCLIHIFLYDMLPIKPDHPLRMCFYNFGF